MSKVVRFLLNLLLTALIAAAATLGLRWAWTGPMNGADMTIHGWIALGLGLFGTCGLTWLLMALAFKSSREGWDDRVDAGHRDQPED